MYHVTSSPSVRCNESRPKLRSANAVAFDGSELNVAIVAPLGAPGVTDDPVVFAGQGAPANHGDGVVDIARALGIVKDATFVLSEEFVASAESNGENSFVEGGLVLGH